MVEVVAESGREAPVNDGNTESAGEGVDDNTGGLIVCNPERMRVRVGVARSVSSSYIAPSRLRM